MSLTFETTVEFLAKDLPAAYIEWAAKECGEAFAPDDEVPDIEVEVEYDPGWFQAGCRSGHPDNWTPDEGENPEITKVKILEGDHDITHLFQGKLLRALEDKAWKDQEAQADDYDPPDYYDEPYDDYF